MGQYLFVNSFRRISFVALALVVGAAVSFAKVDVSKKKEPTIIRPSTSKYQTNKRIQNKRVNTKVIEVKTKDPKMLDGGKKVVVTAGSEKNAAKGMTEKFQTETLTFEALEKKLKSSEEFRKAFEDALRIEFETRAMVEKNKKASEKKQATQDDINRFSKVRDGKSEELTVETAGGR